MTTHPCLPSRNEDYGFFRTLTVCPERDRRSAEVWTLASRMIAECIHADSEDEMIGIRDFLDSNMGRHFADDVLNGLHAGSDLPEAIHTATQRWMGWTIGRLTSKQHGIPKGLPYLTGFVIHCEIVEGAMAD